MLHRIINKMKITNKQSKAKRLDELNQMKKSDAENRIELILSSSFRNEFIRFCIKNHIYENILFYHDILMYKKQLSDKMKKRLSIHIHDKYIKSDAQHEINICGRTKSIIELDKDSNEKYNNAFSHVKEILTEQVNIFLNQMIAEINNCKN